MCVFLLKLICTPWESTLQALSKLLWGIHYHLLLEGCDFKAARAITRQGDGRSKISIGSVKPLLKDHQAVCLCVKHPKVTQRRSRSLQASRNRELHLCLRGRKETISVLLILHKALLSITWKFFSCFFSLIFIPQWNILNRKGKDSIKLLTLIILSLLLVICIKYGIEIHIHIISVMCVHKIPNL